jgi:hypothetical protein
MINLLANVLPNLLLPEDAKPIDRMRHALKTDGGCVVYVKRKGAVAPVFGIIKHVLGFRGIFLRGLEAVASLKRRTSGMRFSPLQWNPGPPGSYVVNCSCGW